MVHKGKIVKKKPIKVQLLPYHQGHILLQRNLSEDFIRATPQKLYLPPQLLPVH